MVRMSCVPKINLLLKITMEYNAKVLIYEWDLGTRGDFLLLLLLRIP